MKYALMFHEGTGEFAKRTDPAAAPTYWAGWESYIQTVEQAGVFLQGAGLEPPKSATTVRLRDGAREVQDGPFADTKEQLGGFIVINVPDLDTALSWAAKSPAAATGAVEVRPLMPPAEQAA